MRSRPNLYQIGSKACYMVKVSMFYIKRIFMSAGWKVYSLACKGVFHRPKNNPEAGPNRTEF